MNIPLKKYVIIKKKYTPMTKSSEKKTGHFLTKIIHYDTINVVYTSEDGLYPKFKKSDAILCSIFGVEEDSLYDILLVTSHNESANESIFCTPEDIPVIKNILISSVISYHILTPEDYPLLVGYHWLDDSFKKEAFGSY